MKLTFQQRLVASFIVIFAGFTIGTLVFEHQRERQYKTRALEERLDAYAGAIDRVLDPSDPGFGLLDGVLRLMPPELRVTVVERDGTVLYDTELDAAAMSNHSDRPEIAAATAGAHNNGPGRGTSIRTSESSGKEYLYYARDDGRGAIVRVALPYNIEVRSLLKPDNVFLYFVVGLFVVGLFFILYLGSYFSASVKQLREHEAREKTGRLKREMTGNIAHELRTPVTSIRGFLEIVLDNQLDEGRRRQYLQRAYAQTQTLSALISDMSLLARIDEDCRKFEFTAIDAAGLLEKVRSDTLSGLIAKNMTFRTEIPPGLTFRGNGSLLYSVFRNLTDNVIAHAGYGVEMRIKAEIVECESAGGSDNRKTARKERRARISFADNGRGILSDEQRERIFERFYRVNEGRTRDTGGSGLGLSIVRNTVALHGGTIHAQNNKPSGLEFIFTLPIEAAEAAPKLNIT